VISAIGGVGPCPMLLIRRVRRSSRAPFAAANRRRGYRSGAPATPGSARRPPQRTSAGLRPRAPRRPSRARASYPEPPTHREATKICPLYHGIDRRRYAYEKHGAAPVTDARRRFVSFLRSMGRRSRRALEGGRWYPRQAEASQPTATVLQPARYGTVRDGMRDASEGPRTA
jgi:hypothetical protein